MTVTLGGIAGLVAALAFAYLVVRLAGLVGKAGRILDETTLSLRTTSDNVQPTLKGLTDTVSLTNDQLTRVDTITSSVSTMTTNASALTSAGGGDGRDPAHQGRGVQLRRPHGDGGPAQGQPMRVRTVLLAAAAVGAGYAVWRLPATQRFVTTVREASARREAELREAVEVAVRADATTRAPRHAPGSTVPDLDVEAGWDRRARDRPPPSAPTTPAGRSRPRRRGRCSSTRPASELRRGSPAPASAPTPATRSTPGTHRHTMTRARARCTPKD